MLRLNSDDKIKILNNDITMKNKDNWNKPYGYIILPIINQEFEIAKENVMIFAIKQVFQIV